MHIRKIAIVGPESTGKSTITTLLARYYRTHWVAEYARYYCAALQGPCTLQDEENMFYGQLALEDSILSLAQKDFIFCDTTFLTVKIWSDATLGESPEIVLETLPERKYDLYLLMDIDLPWEDDPLRNFPGKRNYFMTVWHKELQALNARYVVISGIEDRLQNAIEAVDEFLAES